MKKELTGNYSSKFYFKDCQDGRRIVVLSDGNQELRDLVRSIHLSLFSGSFPDDWIYKTIRASFVDLEGCIDYDEFGTVVNNLEADFWDCGLLEWAKPGYAREYLDQAYKEGGNFEDIFTHIKCAQVIAMEAVYGAVWAFIQRDRKATRE